MRMPRGSSNAAARANPSTAAFTVVALAPKRIGSLPTIPLVSVIEPASFGTERLAPAMTDYLALHPDVSLDLQLNDRVVDLSAHRCLDYTHWNKRVRWRLGDGRGGDFDFPADRFRSNNGQALRMAALGGFGVVMQSEALLGDDVAAGRLVSLLEEYLPPPRPMYLLYPLDRQPLPKLRTFIDFVTKRFAPKKEAAARSLMK
jgi:DNA-binding transcriptional LysR family regulator